MEYEMSKRQLVRFERQYCGKTKYGRGCYGQRLTKSLLDSKRRQYRSWYDATSREDKTKTNYEYLLQFCDGNWFIADCCGLIKGIRAGYRADGTVGRLTKEMDQTIKEMAESLTDVVKITEAGEGEMAYFSDYSHVMTISEKGKQDIESAPSLDGVKEVKIGYQPLSRIGGAGKLPWVNYGVSDRIAEDGIWGKETTKKAQEAFGVKITGKVIKQLAKFKPICKAAVGGWDWTGSSGDGGADLIKEMQKWLGVSVDGHIGPNTIKALQKRMGTPVDGVLSYPSKCVKKFQHWLNKGGFYEG